MKAGKTAFKDQSKEASLVAVADMLHEEALVRAGSSAQGLTHDEALRRLTIYGHNAVEPEARVHAILQFLQGFQSPLTLLLIAVAGVSYALGHMLDGSIIAAMVLMSVTLNFVQEYKAGEAVRTLMEKVRTQVSVVRNGRVTDVPNTDVVPGDIVSLNAGDLVPADGLILSANDFFVNQSSLTGEAFPVEKFDHISTSNDTENKRDVERSNLVFSGTSVVTGTASVLIVKTGQYTEYGKVAADLAKQDEPNEFTRGVGRFSVFIVRMIIVLALVVFSVNTLLKGDVLQSLLFAIAIAVGLTPEFLPVIMSIMMAKGSVKMAKKGVIVKRLSAIPAFGSIDVLCTDKTGTLTEDRIALIECADFHGVHSDEVFRYAYLTSSFQTGITNPLDRAILEKESLSLEAYEKIDEIPFDFERKRMSVVVRYGNSTILVTKGAPEEVLSACATVHVGGTNVSFDDTLRIQAQEQYDRQSKEGFRVLAVAIRHIHDDTKIYAKADEAELEFAGFASFLDPPKVGVGTAIDALEAMAIRIKVITGDNELVTEKICRDADIPILGTMLGSDVRALSDEELGLRVNDISVFARCVPEDKTRIIRALKRYGHVVGYLGDGINDASPLREADVGISVSNAVDVAQESADFILTQKDLTTLRDGVLEGRKSFGNTVKYVLMGLSSNFGNMFSMVGASLLLPFLPMLPIQILLNNFLYDFAQVSVSSDSVDKTFMEKPRRWDVSSLKRTMYIFGPVSSLFDFLTFGVLWYFSHGIPAIFQTGWFIESLATQTLVIHVIRTRYLPFVESSPSPYLLATTLTVTAIGWIIPYTPLGSRLGLVPLPLYILVVIGLIVVAYLLFTELIKRQFYKSDTT